MNTTCNPCACPSPEVVTVPGSPGNPGNNGTNGINAFTTTTGNFPIPPTAGSQVSVSVGSTAWMAVGQPIYVSDGTNQANFTVASISGINGVFLKWLNASGDSTGGTTINSGAIVTAGGRTAKISAPTSAITDNTGGTAGSTLSVGAEQFTLAIYCQLAQLTATTIFSITPGYAFQVLSLAFVVEVAVTTAAKAATITPYVNGISVTGGALALTSANCTPKGTNIAATAITAGNSGTNAQTLALVASSVTTFSEGTGWLILTVKNMDSANALSSITALLNTIRTTLTS